MTARGQRATPRSPQTGAAAVTGRPRVAAPVMAATLLSAVLLSAAPAEGAPGLEWAIADAGAITGLNVTSTFHTDIVNTGTAPDTYRVTLVADMPVTWLTTMCDAGLCYPPFITTLDFTVPAGGSLYVGINITPMVDSGIGTSTVTVTSLGTPTLGATAVFTVVTGDAEVLVVDADADAALSAATLAAVAAGGRSATAWNRAAAGTLAASELATFGVVVWDAGDNAAGLDADDRSALAAYVTQGGRLLLAGADLGSAGDPLRAGYDPTAAAWFEATLDLRFDGEAPGAPDIDGVAGDPVGDGLALAAGANVSPDALAPVSGNTSLRYADGRSAAIRRQAGTGRTLCLGFGIADLAGAAARESLLAPALAWLSGDVTAAPLPATGGSTTLTAAPNPFNPRTVVSLDFGDAGSPDGALDIYDARGRHVRALRRGPFAGGLARAVWDGRDDGGRAVPGGTYLARFSGPGRPAATLKLMLVR